MFAAPLIWLLAALALVPHPVTLKDGRQFTLNLPANYELRVAAEGLRRVRFMAKAPDGRLFVTDLYNRTDNKRGTIYVLDGFDATSGRFATVTPYLKGLRNPNSVAFHVDAAGQAWMYVALTDKLVRYRYVAGSSAPADPPEALATFPAYGLDYKYGGWHLTRTLAFSPAGKLYISVGSSCNACEEHEEVRASVIEMSPDGSNHKMFTTGLRNAVGLTFVGSQLYATNMGADHLGDTSPRDTLLALHDGENYGWPWCYVTDKSTEPDPKLGGANHPCGAVPAPIARFPAHASPLGIASFDDTAGSDLRGSFLVALHGSSKKSLNHGYRIAQVRNGHITDFMTGFLSAGKVIGRPADVFRLDDRTILITDDFAGVIYAVTRK